MSYPARVVPAPLTQFVGSAGSHQTAEQRAALVEFVAAGYRDGKSLRELADLTSRTQTAVRRALDQAGVPRRGSGAPSLGRQDL